MRVHSKFEINNRRATFGMFDKNLKQRTETKSRFFGNAKMVATIHKSAPVIPEESILSEIGETSYYLAVDDRAKRVLITTGWRIEGGLVEKLKGLKPKGQLVFSGQHVLNDGNRIKIVSDFPE